MAVEAEIKPVTLYFQKIKYLTFQRMSQSWKPVSLGGLKQDAQD